MEIPSSDIAVAVACPTCGREFRAPLDTKRVVCTECGAHTLSSLAYAVRRIARWASARGFDRR